MGHPKRGWIVNVRWPQAHTEGREQFGHPSRPFLLLSPDEMIRLGMAMGVPVTRKDSVTRTPWRSFAVRFEREDLVNPGGNLDPGYLLVHQARVIDLTARHKGAALPFHVGTLDGPTMRRVEAAMSDWLGFGTLPKPALQTDGR